MDGVYTVRYTLCICTLVRVICFRRCDVHARCNSRPGGCLYFPFGICVRAQNRNSYIEHLLNWKRMPETFTRKYCKIWLWFLFPTHTHARTHCALSTNHMLLFRSIVCAFPFANISGDLYSANSVSHAIHSRHTDSQLFALDFRYFQMYTISRTACVWVYMWIFS